MESIDEAVGMDSARHRRREPVRNSPPFLGRKALTEFSTVS